MCLAQDERGGMWLYDKPAALSVLLMGGNLSNVRRPNFFPEPSGKAF
jgi:hypothetical protein